MLTGKWTPMNREIGKFNAIYDQTRPLSGRNNENLYPGYSLLFRDHNEKGELRHRSDWPFFEEYKYKWQNPESTQARRTRGRVIEEDPDMFGPDAIPRPSGAPRKSKSQRSSGSSSAASGSSKTQITELMQQQITLDREAKKEAMDRELAARLAICDIQKRNEDLKILAFDTTGMNPGGRGEDRGFERECSDTYFSFPFCCRIFVIMFYVISSI
ncbi:hypothetical protein Tco_0798334 [Tanacetum coccineum]